jgi:hypothetical protein
MTSEEGERGAGFRYGGATDNSAMRTREVLLTAAAAAAGVAIGYVDSRPGWDDTGITAGLLILAAGAVAAVSGRRPWLWALLVGAGTPLFEIPTGGSPASLAALLFAAIGALAGWLVARGWPRRFDSSA